MTSRRGKAATSKAAKTAADGATVTLQQAHDVLRRQRPDGTASTARWRTFHQRAAALYASVAELDGDHHFEALAFAGMARDDAEKCGGDRPDDGSEGVITPRMA